MKNLYISLSLLVIGMSAMAQNKDTKVADKLFSRYEYVSAAKEYLKLVDAKKADAYVYKQLADANYNIFNIKEAINWYAKATTVKQDAETYFRYAQMLKSNKNYEGAITQMKKFVELAPNDSRSKAFNQNPNYVTAISSKEPNYAVKALDINTDKSEFGAVLYGNELFFTSARNTSGKNYGWDKEPFLDVYKSIKGDTGLFSQPTPVTSLNSKFHDGPISITKDGNILYFSSDSFRENTFEKDKKNNSKLGRNNLYKAKKSGDSWIEIKPLPFNSKNYSLSNPSISRDGKTLYFSSNMPGSLGGVDVWKVAVKEDGTYGSPENLGSKVNTEGNESFPFIADDNVTLSLSSRRSKE